MKPQSTYKIFSIQPHSETHFMSLSCLVLVVSHCHLFFFFLMLFSSISFFPCASLLAGSHSLRWSKGELVERRKLSHRNLSCLWNTEHGHWDLTGCSRSTKIMLHKISNHRPSDAQPLPRQLSLGNLSLSFYCWAWCPKAWNIPWISWGQLCQLFPLPIPCAPPALSLVGWVRGTKGFVQALLIHNKTMPGLSTPFPAQPQNLAPNEGNKPCPMLQYFSGMCFL